MFYNPLLPIINIIKKFLYFISKKIFILLLIIVFLAFFIILSFVSESKAVLETTTDYDIILSDNSLINNIYNYVSSRWTWGGIIIFKDNTNNLYWAICTDINRFSNYFNNNNEFVFYNDSNTASTLVNYSFYNDGSFRSTNNISVNAHNNVSWFMFLTSTYLYSDYIVTNTNNDIIYPVGYTPVPTETEPYIQTSTSSIESWNFDYFTIISDIDISNMTKIEITSTYDTFYHQDITEYLTPATSSNSTWVISIPRNRFFNNIMFNDLVTTISFELNIYGVGDYELNNGDSYTLNLTSSQITSINQQKTSSQIEEINSNIDNSNIDNSYGDSSGGGFRDFSDGMEIQDNTSIDSMFNMLYNAFTHDYTESQTWEEPYELELTLPISNQTIKLSPYTAYGRSWYTESDNTAITIVKNLIGSIWWFVIGLVVVKDIRSTINKVAEGNIENTGSDIKKEIL